MRLADNIVCDSIDACRNEAGDFVEAIEKGIFNWQRAVDLAGVVSGKAIGRSRSESVVIFKSVGLAIEDVALGGKLLELAQGGRGHAAAVLIDRSRSHFSDASSMRSTQQP